MLDNNYSPLRVYASTEFGGMSEENNFASALLAEPAKMGTVLSYAFGRKQNNVLALLTGGIGNTKYIENREFEWDVHYQTGTVVDVIENSPQAGQVTPGYGGLPIDIILAENFYGPGDILVTDRSEVTVRVLYDAVVWGAGYKYTVVNTSIDPSSFIDPSLISLGARFSKDYNVQPEFSIKGTSATYQTPVKLRNQLTTMRKSFTVSRSAAKTIMVIELTSAEDPSESTKMWTKLVEWNELAAWYREVDAQMLYSTYNKTPDFIVEGQGSNKRPIYTGAGVREQISPSNKRFYTKLTYNILYEFLLDLSYCATQWGGDTNFLALTGKMGMGEFDRAIKQHAAGNNITVTNSGTFISGTGAALSFDGYFQTVKFLNGISLTVKQFDPYDDTTRNRELHPVTKKPIESYRFTILNFGRKNGSSNIQKVCRKDSDMAMWHVAGSTDPYGNVAKSLSTMKSSGIDGYECHILCEQGIMVEDPLSCGELILRIG